MILFQFGQHLSLVMFEGLLTKFGHLCILGTQSQPDGSRDGVVVLTSITRTAM
jgi:hypothetical protein